MKDVVRYQVLQIPTKLRCEVTIISDDTNNPFYSSTNGDMKSTRLSLRPFLSITIIRPSEINEDGQRQRAPWNPNDNLTMTKYTMPVFIEELSGIVKDMKIPELYTYHGKRLELNEEVAQRIRRVFMIGTTTLELSAQVITQPDDSRVEGIKMKFNNEQSSVMLTLNDLAALSHSLKHLDLDTLGLLMYVNFIARPDHPKSFDSSTIKPQVDILPKE